MYPKMAFVFPGQGSQSVGMLSNLAKRSAMVTETFAEASSALGYDLWHLLQHGPAEQLNQTEFTQPALLTAGVAMWRLWLAENPQQPMPIVLAGHSLGEYTALVCASALELTSAVQLVQTRGRLMQSSVIAGGGAMAAILGLADQDVRDLCMQVAIASSSVVQAVNFNAPGQVVIAGSKTAVLKATEEAKAIGAKKCVLLPVSVPSHCVLMKPIAEQFALQLADVKWQQPKIPVVQNFDSKSHSNVTSILSALEKQLYNPVYWVEIIQQIAALGVEIVAECGPGKILTSLNKRINSELRYVSLDADFSALAAELVAEKVQI